VRRLHLPRPSPAALRTTRRSTLVGAAALVIWALLFRGHPHHPTQVAAPVPAPVATQTAATSAPAETVDDERAADAEATWAPLVGHFMAAYLDGPAAHSPKVWAALLARYCTPTLARGLAHVDPARLPAGTYTGLAVDTIDETGGGTGTVTLSTGQRLTVTVVHVETRLAVGDIEPSQ
jgi:hypothetical protein